LKWAVLGLAALVAAAAGIGWLLPVSHEASRSAKVARPPETVFGVLSDVSSYPKWWSEISQVDMLPSSTGTVRFREHMSTGPVVMEIVESEAPRRLVMRIADPDQPFGGTWTFDISADDGGSLVTITERGEISNPLFRFMARFVFGYTATMDSCLAALGAELGG
jgi:uncharacterized protein YndB with AHSA1/START domain